VRHLPLRGLLDELDSLVGMLRSSTASLTPEEKAVLHAAARCPGGLGAGAARALCGEGVDAVTAAHGLVDKGLVAVDRTPSAAPEPRWRVLDVVREFVAGSEPRTPLPTAYHRFLRDLLARTGRHLGSERSWFTVLAVENANVRMALQDAADQGDGEGVLALCAGMWQWWQASGALTEGRRWLEVGLGLPGGTVEARAVAWWGLAWLAYLQGDDDAVRDAGRRLDEAAAASGDAATQRNARTVAGMLAIAEDRADDAVESLSEALRLARDLGRPWLLATSLLNHGLAQVSAGRLDVGRASIAEARQLYAEIGDERFGARCLGYLGLVTLVDGEPARARTLFGQSLAVFHSLGEPAGTAEGLAGLAAVEAASGNWARAAELDGAASRLREAHASRQLPLERRTFGACTAPLRELAGDGWERHRLRGRAAELDEVVGSALGLTPG
jgi:tetratricopeptide (TPR) repeat protein